MLKRFSVLQVALTASLVIHAALLAWPAIDPESYTRAFQDTPLEVILVNAKGNEAPVKAQAIAQRNLAGGGDVDRGRATSPLPSSAMTELGDSADDARKQIEQLQETQQQLLAQVRRELAALPQPDLKRDQGRPHDSSQDERRRQLLQLLAEIEKRINEENSRPKKRYISPATREEVYAIYYDQLRRKIEERGTRNFPEYQGKKLYGELVMIITVDAGGRIVETEVVQASQSKMLDKRAISIVQAAAPFGPFSAAMRKQADQLVIPTRFRFSREEGVETSVAAPAKIDMDRYVVAGNPVEHSQSPFIHAQFAQASGESVAYDRLLCPLGEFADTVKAFAAGGGRGCNITVPFKFEAFEMASRHSERAKLAQAANVLRFDAEGWWADNSDGIGLVRDIERGAGVPLRSTRVLLIGAGGAAAGALGPLIEAAPAEIVVANRTLDKAEALVRRHAGLAQVHATGLVAASLVECGEDFDVVINATATSMQGAAVPVAPSVLRQDGMALDMMYGPSAAGFLAWATEHGARARDGLGMLVEQAAEAFHVWRGVRPDVEPVLAALRARLTLK